jgi:hypothetical protein
MAKQEKAELVEAEPERTIVYLGNRNTIAVQDGERIPYPGKRCTTVRVRIDATLLEAVEEIIGGRGLWPSHSDGPPAWVAASGPLGATLAGIIAAQYGCEIRDADPEEG